VVRKAMMKLARAYPPRELAEQAYPLYERFRPSVPEGVKGWGAKGDLDLGLIGRVVTVRTDGCRAGQESRPMPVPSPGWQNSMRRAPEVSKPRP
jgi:hypothetical protein